MIILLLILLIVASCFYHFYWKRRGFPPGPLPFPFIGTFHYLIGRSTGEEVFLEWRRKYGDLYTIWQGRQPVVVVAEYNLINEMFVKDADNYSARGVREDSFIAIMGDLGGVFFTSGELWREHRRFALRVLRDLGLGKGVMEQKILEEFQTLSSRMDERSKSEGEFVLGSLIDASVGSIINCLMFGYRYTDDLLSEFYDLSERSGTFMQKAAHPLLLIAQFSGYFHVFKQFPLIRGILAEVLKASRYLTGFFNQKLQEYKDTHDLEDIYAEPTDYTQAFLQEQKRREQSGDGLEYFSDRQLALMLLDLRVAGQETTANTMKWFVAYIIHNPEIQKKAHMELDRVIGSDRLITSSDRTDLPYMSALLNESLRIGNIVPLNIPRLVSKDTEVNGYLLKKGTWVIPQISIMSYDPNIFKDPYQFNPERFLDSSGKLLRSDELIPFSVGKRSCIGEGLARMELFLFLANMLNQYRLLPAQKMPDLTRHIGITVKPVEFKCRVEKRYGHPGQNSKHILVSSDGTDRLYTL